MSEDPCSSMVHQFHSVVITVSDSVTQGTRHDEGGDLVQNLLEAAGFQVIHRTAVPDHRPTIAQTIASSCDGVDIHLVITTGGTGLGPRDVTPEATLDVIEYQVPGMAEAMRQAGLARTPFAMISRQVVGVRNHALVINLPGSPKAVKQGLETIMPVLPHTIRILQGHTAHAESVSAAIQDSFADA